MFDFLRRNKTVTYEELPPIKISLMNIQRIDQAGILYSDADGNSANISYFEAYRGWCKSKRIKRSDPKYICDRSCTYDRYREMIFYTNPQIVFYASPEQETLWFDVIQKITAQGFKTFDVN